MSDDVRKRLHEDPEYVFSKRYSYSISALEERYPDGCPDNVIAAVLMLESDEEVEVLYEQVVAHLRELMGVES